MKTGGHVCVFQNWWKITMVKLEGVLYVLLLLLPLATLQHDRGKVSLYFSCWSFASLCPH